MLSKRNFSSYTSTSSPIHSNTHPHPHAHHLDRNENSLSPLFSELEVAPNSNVKQLNSKRGLNANGQHTQLLMHEEEESKEYKVQVATIPYNVIYMYPIVFYIFLQYSRLSWQSILHKVLITIQIAFLSISLDNYNEGD